MSARVFNPMVMSEFQRMISRNNNGTDTTGQIDGNAVARVRKNLFGPVDHEDNIAFVDRELAAANIRDSEKWGFDFIREKPVKSVASRYVWEKVIPHRDSVPEPYALRRLPYLQKNADNTAFGNTQSSHIKNVSTMEKSTALRRTQGIVKQSQITDFLRSRKRNSPKAIGIGTTKKTIEHKLRNRHNISPSKKKRTV
ncbi:cyclin-dependent kinase inhibitor dacapo [Lycorma delicatula]|uniref:cyclin-dependent kinase inhibitor dacapo n=1 Tax=Lycorma delicatula TaxID=130591 RepID=UPI003F518614